MICTRNLKTAYSTRNGVPIYKGRGVASIPVCANKVRNDPAIHDQLISIASQDSRQCCEYACPARPIPLFLLARTESLTRKAEPGHYCVRHLSRVVGQELGLSIPRVDQ